MTASSIPNGFSSDDLEALLASAAKDIEAAEEPTGEGPYGRQGLTRDELEALAGNIVDDSLEQCSDPMLHKLITLNIVMRFAEWHKTIAKQYLDKGELETAGAWMRDAGKFQAVMDILTSVSLGPDDFACNFEASSFED